jgi:hypothetical protein
MNELSANELRIYSYPHQFKDIPLLDESIWVFGCSFVKGFGVENEQCFTHLLEQRLNWPVANLGIDGASPSRIWNTYLSLKDHGTPKAVVFCWSGIDRAHWLDTQENRIIDLGPWTLDPSHVLWTNYPDIMNSYKDGVTSGQVNQMNKLLIEQAKAQTPNAIHTNIKRMFTNEKFIDLGTDNSHPGPKSHEYIADYLYSILDPAVNK